MVSHHLVDDLCHEKLQGKFEPGSLQLRWVFCWPYYCRFAIGFFKKKKNKKQNLKHTKQNKTENPTLWKFLWKACHSGELFLLLLFVLLFCLFEFFEIFVISLVTRHEITTQAINWTDFHSIFSNSYSFSLAFCGDNLILAWTDGLFRCFT